MLLTRAVSMRLAVFTVLCIAGLVNCQNPLPGDVMQAFNVSTLTLCRSGQTCAGLPSFAYTPGMSVVFLEYHPEVLFHLAMWSRPNLQDFLYGSPPGIHYLICMESKDEQWIATQTAFLRGNLLAAVGALPANLRIMWQQQLHIASVRCSAISTQMSTVMATWPEMLGVNLAILANGKALFSRLDCQDFWCNPSIPSGARGPLVLVQKAQELCSSGGGNKPAWKSKYLLVDDTGTCSYSDMLLRAGRASALGVIVYANPGQLPVVMGAVRADGPPVEGIQGTMISYEAGRQLVAMLKAGPVALLFGPLSQGAGVMFGINSKGQLVEGGLPMFARAIVLSWVGQNLLYQDQVQQQLDQEPGWETKLFQDKKLVPAPSVTTLGMSVPGNANSPSLPPNPMSYNHLDVHLELGCRGPWDTSCPEWDNLVQLFVCCEDPSGTLPSCNSLCPNNWRRRAMSQPRGLATLPSDGCGFELGRWVTPYLRSGSWLMDISPLIPLMPSNKCKFSMTVGHNNSNWTASVSLRFSQSSSSSYSNGFGDDGNFEGSASSEGSSSSNVLGDRSLLSSSQDRMMHEPFSGSRNSGSTAGSSSSFRSMLSGSTFDQQCSPYRIANAAIRADGTTHVQWEKTNPGCENKDKAEQTLGELTEEESIPVTALSTSATAQQLSGFRPFKLIPLWKGAAFDSNYNVIHKPVNFTTPTSGPSIVGAAIIAVITGHGMDTEGCAEFCPVSHHFQLNQGTIRTVDYELAGTQWGCAVITGTPFGQVPNQYGTWFFGRHGWCPGNSVPPLVWDVTADLASAGQPNVLTYKALLGGVQYNGTGGLTEIVLTSHLVLYTRVQTAA